MPRRELPVNLLCAIAVMTGPYFGREVTQEEIGSALEMIRSPRITMGELAESRGITRQAMLYRLNKRGIKPIGRKGKEYLYNKLDVIDV